MSDPEWKRLVQNIAEEFDKYQPTMFLDFDGKQSLEKLKQFISDHPRGKVTMGSVDHSSEKGGQL